MNVDRTKIRELKKIIESPDFYPFLCEFSGNDVNITITNLAKLINYILSTDNHSYSNLEELLNTAIKYEGKNNYLIYGTNSYLDNSIKLFGLKSDRLSTQINTLMAALEENVSYLDYGKNISLPLYGTIEEAINQGFAEPKMLYQGILRQPVNAPKPITVGETEASYYSSILERRMNNVPRDYRSTGATISKKILHEIIGQDVTLYFLPTDKDVGTYYLNANVSPLALRSIKIPSKYKLISICAANKHLQEGTKLSPIDGSEIISSETPKEPEYSSLRYDVYEPVTIDDNFTYTNSELSGDVLYDIDEIYGRLDSKNSRRELQRVSERERLNKIRTSSDLKVEKRAGKYCITNGRHRLLYLKHLYLTTLPEAVNQNLMNSLRNSVTVPILVNKTIEDPEINKLLIYLEKKYADAVARIYKVNIKDDNPDFMIIIGDKVYRTKNKYELIELIETLDQNQIDNRFLIGENIEQSLVPTNSLVAKAITTLGEQILNMNFMEFIEYIKMNEIDIDGEKVDIDDLNYRDLYHTYTYFTNIGILKGLRNDSSSVVDTCEMYLKEHQSNIMKRGI